MIIRPRRLRGSENLRRLVRDVKLSVDDFIYPLFVVEGKGIKQEIKSMPGTYHLSIDNLIKELEEVQKLGIPGVILFGVTDKKDLVASEAYNSEGIVQRALKEAKKHFPDLLLIADVCMCEYTTHGHCGIIEGNKILNDKTLDILAKSAVSYAEAGADILAPSDMMDGRVATIRSALDNNHMVDKLIMSYSVKYASSFYGPFRDAAQSAPAFGDRKTYQMDFAYKKEAIREAKLDIQEGADIIMVKPALAYLDIIQSVKEQSEVPVAAYNVSGEYSMIKAGAEKGWIDEKSIVLETTMAMKRAGADIILTYFAKDLAKWV